MSNYPLSDHYDGKRFFNPHVTIKKSFLGLLKMLYQSMFTPSWPKQVNNIVKPEIQPTLSQDQLSITFVNHATHLIQLNSLNIVTDPIFSKRASPLSWAGPKRVREPGVMLKNVPLIHMILISHNHYDHMDLPTLKYFAKKFNPIMVVPLGNKKYLKFKNTRVIELDWWETFDYQSVRITLVPAQHWSMRKIGDAYTALWGGFWITAQQNKIYFAGDTGYGRHFDEIVAKLGNPNISLLPIGSYAPRWFMKAQHMDPEEAVLASLILKSDLNIASHYHTFRLSHEQLHDPIIELKANMRKYGLSEKKFIAPETGETIVYPKRRSE